MGDRRILVIDDEPLVRKALARILRSNHYEAVFAASLDDACVALGAAPRFDASIADVSVLGPDVASAIDRLRSLQARLPVLLATGGPEPDLQRDDCAFLAKPFTPQALMIKLREVIPDDAR